MKTSLTKMIAALAVFILVASTASAVDRASYSRNKTALKSDLDRASYSVGMSLGNDFKSRGIDINPDLLAMGMQDVIGGNETLLTQEEAIAALQKLQEMALARQQELLSQMAAKNLAEGEAFLAENGKREGVVTTASGLQYEVVAEGTGRSPKASDQVKVDYRGSFLNGTEFDSSYQRGEPASFSVEGIIPGWTEALLLMKEGAKWKLYIPAALGYGEQGAPPVIEPNSTLIFEVELKEVL